MKTKFISIAVILLICAGTLITRGQETQSKEQLWYCIELTVHPDKVDQFLKFNAEEKAFFEGTDYQLPYYTWNDINFHYYYFVPMDYYDDLRLLHNAQSAITQSWEDQKINEYNKTIKDSRDYFLRYKPALSYIPETPRLKEDDWKYMLWDILYIIPGKEKEAYSIARQLSGLLKKINFDDPVYFYAADLGFGGSILIGVLSGKNPTDFHIQNAKMWELMGEEGEEIYNKLMKLLRKREQNEFWYLEDISYEPEKE